MVLEEYTTPVTEVRVVEDLGVLVLAHPYQLEVLSVVVVVVQTTPVMKMDQVAMAP
jgi:hypothetical protein